MSPEWVQILPHVNATLNSLAILLLLVGLASIRRGQESLHKRCMLSAFLVSTAFLCCYLVYHYFAKHRPLGDEAQGAIRTGYYCMLASHIVLAAVVPILAIVTIYLGIRDRRTAHRKVARWTLPIWIYVSVTGILIYIALYWIFPV